MRSESIAKNITLSVFGFIVLIAGIMLTVLLPDAQGVMLTLPYICIGFGAGIFGGNLGIAIRKNILKREPRIAREIQIELNDERNVAILSKAKAKAYDIMQIVFASLIIVFALMKVELYVILAFIAAYLFITFSMLYYLDKYQKEM